MPQDNQPDTKTWTLEQVKEMLGSGGASKVIPVNREIRTTQKILNFSYVENVLKKCRTIGAGECGCRKKLRNCDHTLEGCLFLNDWGDSAIKEGYATKVDFTEGIEILRRTYDEGLVLIAGTEEPPVKICSCCHCCCFVFAGLQQYRLDNSLIGSDYAARHDPDVCQGCGTCVLRCHFGALTKDSNVVSLDPRKCFGCGLCIGKCPSEALTLTEK